MNYGQSLIDKAGKICGSFYKLSKRTGFAQATISEIRKGKRDLPMEWVPVLAEISQVDAREALALVLAEKLPEGSEARQILEKARAAGEGETLPFTYSGNIRGAVAEIAKRLDMLYIVFSGKLRALVREPSTWGFTPYPDPDPSGLSHSVDSGPRFVFQ